MTKDEFIELSGIRLFERVRKEDVRQGIKRLFMTNRFRDIVVIQDDKKPSKIIFRVEERHLIDKIKVEGNKNLRKKDILKHFAIKPDQLFFQNKMKLAMEGLKKQLSVMGYSQSKITYRIDYLKGHRIMIVITIDEGDPFIIERFEVHGTLNDEEIEEFKSKMKVSPGDVYNQDFLVKRMGRLVEYLKEEGFYNPIVGPFTFGNGVLDLYINPGKQLLIELEGVSYFRKKKLKQEMTFWDAGSVKNEVIEESSARILRLYYRVGFVFAQIAPAVQEDEKTVQVTFFIHEGQQVNLKKMELTGNTIDDKRIKAILPLKEGEPFNPDLVENVKDTILEFYYALGFIDAAVEEIHYEYDESRTGASLSIRIFEGAQRLIESITFRGNEIYSDSELHKAIEMKTLLPYNEIDISEARYAIINKYKEKGYLDVAVKVTRHVTPERALIEFIIDEGRQYFFGYTIIRGNASVERKVITRELLNKKGEPFNATLLRKSTQKLYKLTLFSDIDTKVVGDLDNMKNVVMDIEESNPGVIEFGFGYGDYEKLGGFFGISYKNLFGMNRKVGLRADVNDVLRRAVLGFQEPWFYHFPGAHGPVSLLVDFLAEWRKEKNVDTDETRYKVEKYAGTSTFASSFSDQVKGQLAYSLAKVRTFDVQPDVVLSKEDTGTLLISSITPGLTYDSRNNEYNPRKGMLLGSSFEVASEYMFSETDFLKIRGYSNLYHALSKRFTLALSLRGGLAWGYNNTEELPLVERFFLGGRTTVRGYEQDLLGPKGADDNPTGGDAFLMHNLELRINIWKNIGLVTFLDGGNVWVKAGEINLGNYKFTVGSGIRFNTPLGPLRLDYGHKLDREDDESSGEFHFAIGHAF